MIKGKKGDEKLMSIWMFAVWLIVGLCIVIGVLIFYSTKADVRILQSEFLSNRLADCLSENDYLKEEVLEDSFDVFFECKLNKAVFEDKGLFYLNIKFIDADSGQEIRKPIIKGNDEFVFQCELRDISKDDDFAICSRKNLNVLYLDKNSELKNAIISIDASSNNFGSKI